MEEIPEVPAFKDPLEAHREYSQNLNSPVGVIHKFSERSDVVVRVLNWKYFTERRFFKPSGTEKIESAEEFARITKQHFDELREYGIRIPVTFVVADMRAEQHSSPTEEVFAIVDNVERAQVSKGEVGRAFFAMRSALLRYYTDKFEKRTSFLSDLRPRTQYVYGRTDENADNTLYLVDVEPFINNSDTGLTEVLNSMAHTVRQEFNDFNIPEYELLYKSFLELKNKVKDRAHASQRGEVVQY